MRLSEAPAKPVTKIKSPTFTLANGVPAAALKPEAVALMFDAVTDKADSVPCTAANNMPTVCLVTSVSISAIISFVSWIWRTALKSKLTSADCV